MSCICLSTGRCTGERRGRHTDSICAHSHAGSTHILQWYQCKWNLHILFPITFFINMFLWSCIVEQQWQFKKSIELFLIAFFLWYFKKLAIAFLFLSLQELPDSMKKAKQYLESRNQYLTNPYSVAMTSYALANEGKLNKDILFKYSSTGNRPNPPSRQYSWKYGAIEPYDEQFHETQLLTHIARCYLRQKGSFCHCSRGVFVHFFCYQ